MTTPSIIIPSTSVVMLDTTKYTGPIIVQLNSLKTIGTLTTIRDIGGSVSKTKPIILSTASGLNFHDGTSSISIVLPYDTITFQPKTATTYEVLNTFGYAPLLTNTYASTLHTTFLIANSTIAENKYIKNLDLVSSIYVQYSTIFYGPVVLSNSLFVSSPMTYLTAVNAISTVTSNVVANSFSTQQLAVNTVNVINLDIVSSFVDVRGSTTINSKITLLSSFTTQSSANVLQVGTLNSLTISTGKTVANTLYEYSRAFPALCTLTTNARSIKTDYILTFNLQVTNTLSTGLIIPIRAVVKKGAFSTISTGSLYAMNFSTLYYSLSSIDTSSISIADLMTGTKYPIWACNSSIYYDKSVINYEGEEQPTLASTVEGIGSLGYLSSPNLAVEIFSTGRIFSRTISTTEAHVPTFIVPTTSSISTFANNITASQIKVTNTSISDITTYFLQTSNLIIEALFPSQFRVSSLRANNISTDTILNSTVSVSTFSADSVVSQRIQINNLNTPFITASTFTARRVDTINTDASTLVSVDAKTLDLTANTIFASFLTTSTNIFNNNRVSTIQANSVLFNDLVSSQGRLYLNSGIFYANTQQLTSLSNVAVDIQSTSIGLGTLGYLSSSTYILDAFSTQQLLTNQILTSSSYFATANIGNGQVRQLQTDSFQTNIYRFASTNLSTTNSSQGRFSTLIVQRIATQNLSVDRAVLTGAVFNFDSLTLTQGAFSSISTAFLRTSTLNTRSTSSRFISTGLFSASTIFANQVVGNEYNLSFITARTTNAIETDSGVTRTSSITSRQTLNSDNITIGNHTFFRTNINTNNTIGLQISSIRQTTTYFEATSLFASTVRTSTLTINDQTLDQVNELFPSNLLYFNNDAIMNVNVERNLLISTVEGLGQIPYISSYGSEFLIAISTTSIRASSVVANNLTTNVLNARSTLLTTLNTVSASAIQINARNILTVSTFTSRNLLNPSLIGDSVRTIATSSPNLFTSTLITSSFSNRSALNTNDISTISITSRSMSSIQLNTTNLLVPRINADSMAVNQVSTGSLIVSIVNVDSSFIGSTISSANIVANTISTSLLSTLQVSVSSISSLSLQASSINAQSTNINSLTTTLLSNASLRTSNIVTSTLSIGGTSLLSLSGQLYIDGQPLQTESSITNSLTSTSIGLGSSGYLSTIQFLSLSTQQLFTSSISTLNLSTNSIRTSFLDTTVLFTSSITVNTANASYFNTSTINGQLTANSGLGLATATSSINATILSSYTITTSSINSQDAVFGNLLITSLEPSTITANQVIAPSSFNQDASVINTISQTLTTSTIQTASISTTTLSTNTINSELFTTSSISTANIYTDQFYTTLLNTNSLETNLIQINTQGLPSVSTNIISTGNIELNLFTASTFSINSVTSQNINASDISTQQLITDSISISSTTVPFASSLTTTITQATSYSVTANTVLYSSIQGAQLLTSSIQVQSTSATLVNVSTSYVSSVNFQGNTLTATDTELFLNGSNVATATDINTNVLSTSLLNAGLVSSVSTIHVNGLTQTGWIRQNNGITRFATSTFYNSTLVASTVQIGNLAINSNQTATIQPTNQQLVLNSLLTIQSSSQLFIGNLSSASDKLFVDGSARVPSTFASSVEYSSITTNKLFYTNLTVSSLSTSYFIQNSAVAQQLNISSIGGSSTVILTADATFGLFYGTNPSTFIQVGYSTFTSTATTVATNGKIYVAGGKTIPSFWGASSIGSNTLAYSVNGLTWQGLGTNGFTQGVNRVIWDGQAFIAVGEGATTISRSVDGINWQQVADSTLFTNANAVVKGYNGYVAVGSGPNSIATSPDGITWTGRGTTVSEAKAIATNGRVYVTGKQASFDGITWSNTTIPLSTVNDVKYNGLYFVAVGAIATNGTAKSPDGFTWTPSPSYTAEGNSLNWSGDKWLLTGASTAQLAYSTDGATWVNPIPPYTEVISTFQYTGASTIVTAPQGTEYVTVQIWGAGGAGGASTFQPAYLGNLQVWLDANDQDTILISSISSVVAWTDKSSNAYVLSTVQTCPAYNSSLSQLIFQSTSLSLPSNAFTSTTAYTFALIGSFGNGDQTLYGGGSTTLSVSTNRFRLQGASTFTQISTNSTILLTYYTDVSSLTWRINGSQDSIWSGSYPITNPNQLFFGSVNDSRTNWRTNEFLAFNSNLPTATVQQIEGYLAWKWGAQSNLPVSHPYKNDFSSIHAGGGGAYIEGVIPLQVGQGSTFGIYVGQGGKFNVSTASMGAYYDSQGRLYFSTSGGISYDPAYGRFYPNYFSTLGLWLDGTDPYGTGSLPADGTAINTWIDKSVANRNASSIGGQTATFQQGSLQFSTAAYQIDYANFNSTAYTIFTVQLQTSNNGTYQTVLSGGSSSNPTLFSGVLSNTIASFTGINGQYNNTLANSPETNAMSWRLTDMLVVNSNLNPFIDGLSQVQKLGLTGAFSTLFLGALSPGLPSFIGSNNDLLVYNADSNVSTFTETNIPLDTLYVYDSSDGVSTIALTKVYINNMIVVDDGTISSTNDLYKHQIPITNWIGSIGEVLCFDTALSKKQRQIIEGYLASKWGLQSNLPLNHPYRNSNIYSTPMIKGGGGGGAATGLLLPNGQAIVAGGGGGGGQGTQWDGGAGGLDVGQRGAMADGCNIFGYSPYAYQQGIPGAGGGGGGSGGQGAYAPNGAHGGDGTRGQGGQGGADGWHLSLPGGGGGGGAFGGGGGAVLSPAGGGNSLWRTVAGFLPSFTRSKPGYGQGQSQGMTQGNGGTNQSAGSDGFIKITFQTQALNSFTALTSANSLTNGYQNITIGSMNLQTDSPPLYIPSTTMIQAFYSTLVINNTMFIDSVTNKVGINISQVSTATLQVNGAITKTAGSFVIDHPDPSKESMKLRHCFVESPTHGDTIYRWCLSTVDCCYELTLPSYFTALNTNPQVWVTPDDLEHVGRATVQGGILKLETTGNGLFTVLCVATRKDLDAVKYFDKDEYC